MSYVSSADRQPGCVFCDKPREEEDLQNGILARGPNTFIILNAYPYNSGHMMVVPYGHHSDFTTVEPAVTCEMMAMAQIAIMVLQQEFSCEGANLGLNLGKPAGAGIADHIHLHIVPRWTGDTNFMTTLGDTRVVPQSLEETCDRLAPALQEMVAERLPQMLP
jgi:ATP adenylyltransferase